LWKVIKEKGIEKKKKTTPAGLEPARRISSRFLVYRLNRSATVSCALIEMWLYIFLKTLYC
jgi:hypothetical protein